MKNLTNILMIIALLSTLAACTQQNKEAAQTDKVEAVVSAATNFSIKDENQQTVLNQYLSIKDALVASNSADAQQAAKNLQQTLAKTSGFETAQKMVDSIATSSELAQQRKVFTNLNNELIPIFRKAVLSKGAFYVQFCPMANEGSGGYWLAQEEEVRNPYYGDEMLNCGEVKETIK
ncbi:MAG: hypothetical protein RLZ47_1071 [Bacteroidota bacterium]|jgi:predicted small lipoprotein YifL